MDPQERKKLIALYRDGYRAIVEVLQKITPEELDAKPGASRWTAREIVHHLADSEMTAAVRLRVLIAEDVPTIHGYDQDEFAGGSTTTGRTRRRSSCSAGRVRRRRSSSSA